MSDGQAPAAAGHPVVGVRHRHSGSRDTTWRRYPTTPGCCRAGIDNSPACIGAVLAAINHAHALESASGPWCCRADFAQMSIPDQLFVAVNLERVDRGLPAFGGLTTALDRNAQQGADDGQRPTRPGAGLRPRRRGVGGRVVQRPRRGLRMDVRRRVRQRQPRLPASWCRRVLGAPQGHPRRLRLRPQPGDGSRLRHGRRHAQGATPEARRWR